MTFDPAKEIAKLKANRAGCTVTMTLSFAVLFWVIIRLTTMGEAATAPILVFHWVCLFANLGIIATLLRIIYQTSLLIKELERGL